jgi:hypothetical protein
MDWPTVDGGRSSCDACVMLFGGAAVPPYRPLVARELDPPSCLLYNHRSPWFGAWQGGKDLRH